jgi:hypothetical protein
MLPTSVPDEFNRENNAVKAVLESTSVAKPQKDSGASICLPYAV